MIITISGKGGSGKSTCAKLLCEKLGFARVYGGQVFRDNAKKMGMDLFSYLKYLNEKPELEKEIDNELMKRCESYDNVVRESRVGKVLYPQHIGIFLDVSVKEGTRRIMGDLEVNKTRNEVGYDNYAEAMLSYEQRIDEDRSRYLDLYGKNIYDLNVYDIVIDTTSISVEQVVAQILQKIDADA